MISWKLSLLELKIRCSIQTQMFWLYKSVDPVYTIIHTDIRDQNEYWYYCRPI